MFHALVCVLFCSGSILFDDPAKGSAIVLERQHRQHRPAYPISGAQLLPQGQVRPSVSCLVPQGLQLPLSLVGATAGVTCGVCLWSRFCRVDRYWGIVVVSVSIEDKAAGSAGAAVGG